VQESILPLSPRALALPALLQYYCVTFAQDMTPPPTLPLYAIHHTILVMTISCKGESTFSIRSAGLTPPVPVGATHVLVFTWPLHAKVNPRIAVGARVEVLISRPYFHYKMTQRLTWGGGEPTGCSGEPEAAKWLNKLGLQN